MIRLPHLNLTLNIKIVLEKLIAKSYLLVPGSLIIVRLNFGRKYTTDDHSYVSDSY